MKIGILTYHAAYNFGANLQALSTYNYLRNAGHEPKLIDFVPEELERVFDSVVPQRQAEIHKDYLLRHFIKTSRCRNSRDVADVIISNSFDGIIIGSDAVIQHHPLLSRIKLIPSRKWLLKLVIIPVKYETNFPNPFWGEFIDYLEKSIPVAMMSVSCQNTDYKLFSSLEKKQMNSLIQQIRYVSVRDQRTKELFGYITKNRAKPNITPDPVFSFNQNFKVPEKSEILNKFNLPEKYILVSFNSNKFIKECWIQSFVEISRQKGQACVALAMPGGIKFNSNLEYKIDIPLDPVDWYCVIKYSSAYVGEKMHPIIVCLHNAVPFFSFDHYGILRFRFWLNKKTSKIYQILQTAGYENNRCSIIGFKKNKIPQPQFVYNKIETFDRKKCQSFSTEMAGAYIKMMKELVNKLKTDDSIHTSEY